VFEEFKFLKYGGYEMKIKKSKIFKNIFSNHQKYGWFGCYALSERRAML